MKIELESGNSKYTADRIKRLLDAVEMGATITHACGYAGIKTATFYRWLEDKPDFREQVDNAEGKATVKWLLKIEQAANNGQWQAAAWKLERRFPNIYGRRVVEQNVNVDYVVDLSGTNENNSQALESDNSPKQILE
jgi:hypothetical protein